MRIRCIGSTSTAKIDRCRKRRRRSYSRRISWGRGERGRSSTMARSERRWNEVNDDEEEEGVVVGEDDIDGEDAKDEAIFWLL